MSVSELFAGRASLSVAGARVLISCARAWMTTVNSDRVSRTFAASRLIRCATESFAQSWSTAEYWLA
jgi:hypothetical protein